MEQYSKRKRLWLKVLKNSNPMNFLFEPKRRKLNYFLLNRPTEHNNIERIMNNNKIGFPAAGIVTISASAIG